MKFQLLFNFDMIPNFEFILLKLRLYLFGRKIKGFLCRWEWRCWVLLLNLSIKKHRSRSSITGVFS